MAARFDAVTSAPGTPAKRGSTARDAVDGRLAVVGEDDQRIALEQLVQAAGSTNELSDAPRRSVAAPRGRRRARCACEAKS